MFGRKKRGVDAEQLVPIMVEAFAAERLEVTHDRHAILIAMPGGLQAPIELQALLDGANRQGANQQDEASLREFADGVVRGFIRGCRKQGILVGTHYPLPEDDLAGHALLDAFRAAGLRAMFVDPRRVSVLLADESEAVTDVGGYRAEAEGASPEALATKAAEFVRLSAAPLRDAGTSRRDPSELRLRLYPEETLGEPIRSGVVSRELAPGLWETVAVDRPDSVQPLPRRSPGEPDAELYRVAIGNAVEDEFTTTWFDVGDARVLHIGGEHPYMAAHVHVLGRYLDAPLTDGALVSFPLPEVVLVHPLGAIHPVMGLAQLQEVTGKLVDGGQKAISKQVFWWRPSERERPDLRPVHVAMNDGRIAIHGDDEFRQLIERFG